MAISINDNTCLAYRLRKKYILDLKNFSEKRCMEDFEDTWYNPQLRINLDVSSFNSGCNPCRRTDWAIFWAENFHDKDAEKWLENYTWETGIWLQWHVIIFFRFDENDNLKGMILYRLDALPWNEEENTWFVFLGINGHVPLIIPEWDREYTQEEFFDGLEFMLSHHGKNREEWEENQKRIEERRRQFREERLRKESENQL